jgi:starvation-inducible outer membrane lipoprotein
MKLLKPILLIFTSLCAISCSVMSFDVKRSAMKDVPFKKLVGESEQYVGQTVILGGLIVSSEQSDDQTILFVRHTPLNFWDQPEKRDASDGRFMVLHEGPLDPVLYKKDHGITVAGTIMGVRSDRDALCPAPCLELKSLEIYVRTQFPKRETDYSSPLIYDYGHDFRGPWSSPGDTL